MADDLRKKVEKKETILLVDDEDDVLRVLEKRFSDQGYRILTAHNGKDALQQVDSERPDLIILDVKMPVMDGLEVKARLNADPITAEIPVVFLTALGTTSDKIKGFRLMADDYATKPFEFDELLARVRAVLERRHHYQQIAMTDALSGLYNAHVFQREHKIFFHLAKRYKRIFSLAVIDIDGLKAVNDRYGHRAGDFVIQTVAEAMRRTFRQSDIPVRYGGDEFVILFPESGADQAMVAIARLKCAVEGKSFPIEGTDKQITISLSIGFATYYDGFKNENEMFELADRDMYEQKSKKVRN